MITLFDADENGHYAFFLGEDAFYLEHFSGNNMAPTFSKKLEVKTINGLEAKFFGINDLDGGMVMFAEANDEKNSCKRIYGYKLDKRGEVISEGKEIMTIPSPDNKPAGELSIINSEDKSKLLAIYREYPGKNATTWHTKMKVLIGDFVTLKEIETDFPLPAEKGWDYSRDFLIGNDGIIYAVIRHIGPNKTIKLRLTQFMNFYMFDPSNGFEEKVIPFNTNNTSISAPQMKLDEGGNLIGVGLYGKYIQKGLLTNEGLAGTYYFKVNRQEEEVSELILNNFDQGLLSKLHLPKKRSVLPSHYFYPQEMRFKDNGSIILLSEYSFNSGGKDYNIVTSGPILVTTFTSSGDIDRVDLIPKSQVSRGSPIMGLTGAVSPGSQSSTSAFTVFTGYHSYAYSMIEDHMYFIFNDNPDNNKSLDIGDIKPLNETKKAVTVIVRLDEDGDMVKSVLAEEDKKEVIFSPIGSYQVDETLIIYGYRAKALKMDEVKAKFGIITF